MIFDKTKNKQTGGEGEEIVAQYLEDNGYKIIDRNVEFPFGEIDILAQIKKVIVIVEVKTVRGGGFGSAQELVRFKKQNKLRLLARAVEQKYPGKTVRIDVVGVEFGFDGKPEIDHIISAVEG
ncbi:MAG TPA: YraN family protein [Patescibacteria group bacterium]|nr:YraN family protein [Patescibacteria group bacterium]